MKVPVLQWHGDLGEAAGSLEDESVLLNELTRQIYVLHVDNRVRLTAGGSLGGAGALNCLGIVPAIQPSQLGDPSFSHDHDVRFAYYAGAMANGISSEEMVIALGSQRILSVFGAGGLSVERVRTAIHRIQERLPNGPYAINLLHNPGQPGWEMQCVKLFIERDVRLIEASAYINLTPAIVYFRLQGLGRAADGTIIRRRRIIAKVAHPDVAAHFLNPAPEKIVRKLLADRLITEDQAALAALVPVADDITVEGDSGGHTDNGVLSCIFRSIAQLSEEIAAKHRYATRVRVGVAGGIGSPHAVLSAFALDAAYVATGSINQACVEAGTSNRVKQLLGKAGTADVAMAPSADMFEIGAKVQVLKSGTMYAVRAQKLHALYKRYECIEDIPAAEITALEQTIFKRPLPQVWEETSEFLRSRGNEQALGAAQRSPKKKMALLFQWYLGQSSRWAIAGDEARTIDYQVWCGPAMAAANDWLRGTEYEAVERRGVADIADLLMTGATYLARVTALKQMGVDVPAALARYVPVRAARTPGGATGTTRFNAMSFPRKHGEQTDMNAASKPLSTEPDTKLNLKLSREFYKQCWELMPGGTHYNFGDPQRPMAIPFNRGRNSRVWDLDGNEHLDLFCKFGALFVGHHNEAYQNALTEYMKKVTAVDTCDLEVEACSLMIKHIPCAEMVRFCLSGTEAVQNALRLARGFTGKNRFIRFHGHYHGNADNIMGWRARQDLSFPVPESFKGDLMDTLGRATNILEEQSFLLPWDNIEVLAATIERYKDEIAAVLMEPFCMNGGGIFPREGYLESVKALCEENNIVLIFDEIITGVRIGLGGAQELLGVTPHLATFGKALAGGAMPVSAIAGRRDIMSLYARGKVIHAGTFNGYPLGLAAVKATFELVENDPGCYERMGHVTAQISDAFVRAAHAVDMPLVLQGMPTALVYHSQDTPVDRSEGYSNKVKFCDVIIREICKRYGIQFSPLSRIYSNLLMSQDDVRFFEERIVDAMDNARKVIEVTFKEGELV